ncbi:MAG TPA: N-acetyltransferase [Candidatus Saccharimonadia bacterium]|nr:N-acetyltransferase [Candidatus Saccharimonadia bacterium]
MKEPLIREETGSDIPRIREVILAAFGGTGEADLVDALRHADALTLSFVAEVEGMVVGHVAFSPITIGDHQALALAPLAVDPAWQRGGIGSSLTRCALEACRAFGHQLVIVLGSTRFYGRFGFTPALPFGIECPFEGAEEHFMVLELNSGAALSCHGRVRYRPEFDSL